ncbi:MAG TPA: ATP-dependent protease ATPase subunit HslU [Myxococcota bacterium]|nr:ATP-dependent protease ATPase subunit HslU [Myxococcota bacterium]HRY96440.1 ATP-dependent protease ATPase subunit HslU [Myxococcota bacterium]HSA22707.1 ATP-dependent protease ATPase subunit HslU [Myxococcota bacterium]
MTQEPTGGVSFTPREIVSELDRYIVGQAAAKRAVAIALRNRWRRQRVPEELRDEIAPKNIIMIGPTGVGKTEIARRLAKLAQAPFLKVEASKYTEVGYVGRDVESMIRDLVEVAVKLVREEETERVQRKAQELAEERLLDLLVPPRPRSFEDRPSQAAPAGPVASAAPSEPDGQATREKLRRMLRDGALDSRELEVSLTDRGMSLPMMQVFSTSGVEEMNMNLQDMLGNLFPKKSRKRKLRVPEALQVLTAEEASKLVDNEGVVREAVRRAEQSGIIFIDEIDKIAGREQGQHGPDVSRQGVQRDLLPIVEGSAVATKYGVVHTQHVLFIAAGAFNVAKPADLIPELQGRFPIRVELSSLTRDDFLRILTEPRNALAKQYEALLATEGVTLTLEPAALARLAELAEAVNRKAENIGARRLHTVLEKLLEELSFKAPEMGGQRVVITPAEVDRALGDIVQDQDLSRYIL